VRESKRNLIAVLTPAGVGAIAVVRLQGPEVLPFLQKCFSKTPRVDQCVHGEVMDDGKIIDDPVVVLSSDGKRADINLHGGAWVVRACIGLAERHGFSVVDARSAPLPDFVVDAKDELEAEILACLPLARTELALRVLLAQTAAWGRLMVTPFELDEANRLSADRSLHWLLHPPRVAIVGIPNAGKSTLANQLFGQQRSITADLPGTTRDWVGEIANIDGLAVHLVDTPGIRASDDSLEMEAIGRAADQVRSSDAVVLVMDATRLNDPSQRDLSHRFADAIRVVNKVDAVSVPDFGEAAIGTVATSGQGIDQLRSAMLRRFGCEEIEVGLPRCWTERQLQFVRSLAARG
jgi:tRNA modification GTPase